MLFQILMYGSYLSRTLKAQIRSKLQNFNEKKEKNLLYISITLNSSLFFQNSAHLKHTV